MAGLAERRFLATVAAAPLRTKALGNAIRTYRKKAGLTQERLAVNAIQWHQRALTQRDVLDGVDRADAFRLLRVPDRPRRFA